MRKINIFSCVALATLIFTLGCSAEETAKVDIPKKEIPIETFKLNKPEPTVEAVVATPNPDPEPTLEAEATVEPEPVEPEITYNSRLYAYVVPEPEPEPEILDSDYGEDVQHGEYHEDVPQADSGTYLGDWTITFYCTGSCCNGSYSGTASGAPLTPWHTCACTALPFGTTVYIEGVGTFVVEDTGVSGSWIDCCVSSHDEALALGMRTAAVYIVG